MLLVGRLQPLKTKFKICIKFFLLAFNKITPYPFTLVALLGKPDIKRIQRYHKVTIQIYHKEYHREKNTHHFETRQFGA